MKKLFLTILMAVATMGLATAKNKDEVKITVSNPIGIARSGEMVEINMADIQAKLGQTAGVIVTDADGREVPSQVTHDRKLIFQASVAPKGKSVYYAKTGKPASYEARVFGRQFPERVDDIAWETDRVAFRCYGPALQKSGERAWGYDIWNKRTSKLVVEDRYASELNPEMQRKVAALRSEGKNDEADDLYNSVSYHVDHGNGMDCYKVGPTLGCGTNALLTNGEINYPRCYHHYEILDKGPLRFTVMLVYGTENINGHDVTETRIVSLDAGSHLNKAIISYEGLTAETPMAVGIVVHNENPTAYILNSQSGYMGYEDLGDPLQYKEKYRATQNKDFGKIYAGAVFPEHLQKMEFKAEQGLPGATGHILSIAPIAPSAQYTYYFGSGWSRNPETSLQSLTDWEAYLNQFAQQVKAPLKVKVK